jgi:hypothetical protein
MKESTEATGELPVQPCFEYLHTLRTCADTLLGSLASMEAVELGSHHEEVLGEIAKGMELLGEAALAIDLHLLIGGPGGSRQAASAMERELIAALVEVMGVVEQVHSRVLGFQRMLTDGGGEQRCS